MRHALWSLLLLLLGTSAANALMLEAPFEAVAKEAATVVEGTVLERHSFWNDSRTTILTDVVIQPRAALKGQLDSDDRIVVRIEGGEVGDVGIWVEHQPRFLDGEEVLLFLRPSAGEAYRKVVQLEQGKFRLIGHDTIDFRGRQRSLQSIRQAVRAIDSN